jgi:acyl carrier protein
MLKAFDKPRIEAVISEQINLILAEKSLPARTPSPSDKLHDTIGLSSLDLAILVSELELAFGTDPFAKLVPITDMRTVGDLVRAYALALIPNEIAPAEDPSLADARERAQRRTMRRRT